MHVPILIVTTSHAALGRTGKPTGLWLEELAAPYYALRDAGRTVEIASIAGGQPPIDPASLADPPAAARRFQDDPVALAALAATPPVALLDPAAYAGIFLPGGHGTMWDLPGNAALARLVGALFDAGRPVAAVCHGPAGLVGAIRADGKPVVAGRKVASFTDAEERAAGLAAEVPFLLESRLRALGAKFSGGPDWQPHAVRDGNLVTGQNPASSELVAGLLLEMLPRLARVAA
jgi:putative intracellular protease/amidase